MITRGMLTTVTGDLSGVWGLLVLIVELFCLNESESITERGL